MQMQTDEDKKGWSFSSHLAFKRLNSKDAQTLLLQLAECKISLPDFRTTTYLTVVKYVVMKHIIDWAHQSGQLGKDAKASVTETDFFVSTYFLVFVHTVSSF